MRKRCFHRMFSFVLITALTLSMSVPAFAAAGPDRAEANETQRFTVVGFSYPEGEKLFNEDFQKYMSLRLRYKDNKSPIPLSAYYEGKMFATLPAENAKRETEVYFSEQKEFNDYQEAYSYEFYVMEVLSAVDVIRGDDKGNANPLSDITRAEAAAMVMRAIGVDQLGGTDSGFADVAADAWYAKVITKAKELGIVEGDSDTSFSPNRKVSREEMTTMVARSAWCAGLQKEKQNVTLADFDRKGNVKDAEKVSVWARSAYATMRYFSPFESMESGELDAEGIPETIALLHPQKNCNRFEASEMIMRMLENFQIYPSQAAVKFGFDEEMPVMDGSTSTYPYTEAIYNTLFRNGAYHPDRPAAHSKSHASYEKLIDGEIDMMIASVYPAQDILDLAAEKNVKLELIPIAYDAMVFFTNKDNPADNLTMDQISRIYVENQYANWKEIGGPDALLYPYARNYDSGSHAQMERYFLNGKDINETIRKETTSITMSNILTDVMGAETDAPKGYGLGYSIYYYFNNMDGFYNTKSNLKLLSIEGVAPNDDTIADGSYPLSNNTYIVVRSDSPKNSPARKMAAFMLTETGQSCVVQAGYGPLKK